MVPFVRALAVVVAVAAVALSPMAAADATMYNVTQRRAVCSQEWTLYLECSTRLLHDAWVSLNFRYAELYEVAANQTTSLDAWTFDNITRGLGLPPTATSSQAVAALNHTMWCGVMPELLSGNITSPLFCDLFSGSDEALWCAGPNAAVIQQYGCDAPGTFASGDVVNVAYEFCAQATSTASPGAYEAASCAATNATCCALATASGAAEPAILGALGNLTQPASAASPRAACNTSYADQVFAGVFPPPTTPAPTSPTGHAAAAREWSPAVVVALHVAALVGVAGG